MVRVTTNSSPVEDEEVERLLVGRRWKCVCSHDITYADPALLYYHQASCKSKINEQDITKQYWEFIEVSCQNKF
jgi:hypothetical protein